MPNNRVFTHIGHDDHGISPEQVEFVMTHPALLDRPADSFILEVIALPEELGTAPSALYGPEAGDEPVGEDRVFYETRGNRKGPSRLMLAGHRSASNLVVIGIRGSACFTMYGTQADTPSPKEPWDAANEEELARCLEFWNQHCLAEPNPEFLGLPSYSHGHKYRVPLHLK